MDTKWKKWTAIKAVKIISFALIIVLSCVIANRVLQISERQRITHVSPEILFTDVNELPTFANVALFEPESLYNDGNAFYISAFDTVFHGMTEYHGIQGTVIAQYTFQTAQIYNMHLRDVIIIVASLVLLPVLLMIQLAGAGRKYKADSKNVQFLIIDRPYLDISFAVLILWATLIVVLLDGVLWGWRRLPLPSFFAANMIFFATIALIFTPGILWLLSFAKRAKAGAFWKHTLIYAILSRAYSLLLRSRAPFARVAKSLWVDSKIRPKVVIISLGSFVTLIFVGIWGAIAFGAMLFVAILIALGIAYITFNFAGRILKLQQGARTINEGNYDSSIDVGGGELGDIAESINNISTVINKAVDERMKSERLKTELITNVSHDIRTPLTSIITYSDLLKTEGLESEKAPEYLDILIQKSQRLKTLTDELFEASKAATGNIDVKLEVLDCVSLVNQVLGELDGMVKSSGLELRVNMPENLNIRADGRLMQRVVENLLSNALKYSLPASRIYLSVCKADDIHVQIELKNISASELNFAPSELTERFKRGDDARSDGGSGLGLSIVQSFVSVQDGKFEIQIDGDLFKAIVTLPSAQ